jgi:microcin C transport system substrate-binding protein
MMFVRRRCRAHRSLYAQARTLGAWLWALLMLSITVGVSARTGIDASADDSVPDYRHGYAFLSEPAYPADFQHTNYVNPDAPKGGEIRIREMGTWDNFNNLSLGGRQVRGVSFWVRQNNYLYDSLMEPGLDEPATLYGRLAEGVAVDPDGEWIAFKLRADAYWHDGEPITVDDVVFSFNAFKNDATPTISSPLAPITGIEVIGEREVRYLIAEQAKGDPILPRRLAIMPVLPEHYWRDRDVTKTTVEPPLGSGPYRIGEFSIGRWIKWQRVDDYWGKDLPINKGRYNFDTVKVDYFRDDQVQTEAFKGNVIDIHLENVAQTWATAYDTPALRAGMYKKTEFAVLKPAGLWWPIFWNMDQPRFHDIRVREALWLMSDFEWGSRRSYGFWGEGLSFFNDSELASRGLPSEAELALLEPLRGQIPERVFTQPYQPAPNQGSGWHRENFIRAAQLLREAGWIIRDGRLVHQDTGEPFHLRFLAVSPALGKAFRPLTRKLQRLGISSTVKAPEISNWLYRMRAGDFDAGAIAFLPDYTPTLLSSNTFNSAGADQAYSYNWSNLRDPAIDALVTNMYKARSWDQFVAACRALDRVLLANFYWMPGSSKTRQALAYWDKFGQPEHGRLVHAQTYVDLWWIDEAKAARVADWMTER